MFFKNLIFLAEPFGFGPISSSIVVARQIKALAPSKKIIFIGCGTSHQLAIKSSVFNEVYFTEALDGNYLASFNDHINNENSLIIANTYPDGVLAAKQASFTCLFIDTLFWMWKQLPIDLNDVKKYYMEDFRCVDLKPSRFGESGKYKVVPALIDVSVAPRHVTHPFLLVSLGGIDSSLYNFPIFYEKLIEYISKSEQLNEYTIMVCGGGKKFQENEFKKFERPGLTITCLGPEEYISYLKSADFVLSSAGLHGFYENYFLKKNVLFLPPQSYSQYLQLKYIQAYFHGLAAVNFEQLGVKHTLRENMPDEERIKEVKRTNWKLIEEQAWVIFCNAFEMFQAGVMRTDWSNEKDQFHEEQDGPALLARDILSHGKS